MASRAWLLVAAALAASASASVLPASRGRAARCWRPTPRSALPPARPARAMPPVAMMADKDNVEAKRVIMKFGGSSVRDAERVSEVCTLVQKRITELGIEPHLVCSAMGKTTNNLLAAAKKALEDKEVDLSAVRKLHSEAAEQLGVTGTEYYQQIVTLLDECERVLEGVALLGELSPRTNDLLVSFGERMSGRMVAARFNQIGVPAVQIESWDLGVITDSNFGDASVLDDSWPVIRTKLNAVPKGTVAVITGFIGARALAATAAAARRGGRAPARRARGRSGVGRARARACVRRPPAPRPTPSSRPTPGARRAAPRRPARTAGKDKEGRITTLGRGGSDLTASLVGAAAGFDEVQVWKDVDGILTADPRACPNAKPVPYVTFEEAAELAYFGAQVLHPVAMQPAMRVDIPVRVKNSYNPEAKGTLITRTHQEPPLVSVRARQPPRARLSRRAPRSDRGCRAPARLRLTRARTGGMRRGGRRRRSPPSPA